MAGRLGGFGKGFMEVFPVPWHGGGHSSRWRAVCIEKGAWKTISHRCTQMDADPKDEGTGRKREGKLATDEHRWTQMQNGIETFAELS
jgi:hypothetical protein